MSFTLEDISALKKAIATGALKVRYADSREVTYRSLTEMREILRMMQAEVGGTSGSAGSRSFVAAL